MGGGVGGFLLGGISCQMGTVCPAVVENVLISEIEMAPSFSCAQLSFRGYCGMRRRTRPHKRRLSTQHLCRSSLSLLRGCANGVGAGENGNTACLGVTVARGPGLGTGGCRPFGRQRPGLTQATGRDSWSEMTLHSPRAAKRHRPPVSEPKGGVDMLGHRRGLLSCFKSSALALEGSRASWQAHVPRPLAGSWTVLHRPMTPIFGEQVLYARYLVTIFQTLSCLILEALSIILNCAFSEASFQ